MGTDGGHDQGRNGGYVVKGKIEGLNPLPDMTLILSCDSARVDCTPHNKRPSERRLTGP